jgi:3-phytase
VITDRVASDADDPAIWVDVRDPTRSLVLGTNKVVAPGGSLVAFNLEGRVHDTVPGLDRPNNVDVEYGLPLDGGLMDIAVVTERKRNRLRAFRIDPTTRRLEDVSGPDGIPVLAGQQGEAAEPMGIGLYKRPRDGAVFAIVSPKTGGTSDYLWQYRLEDDGTGRVRGTLVRRFGTFSGTGPDPEEQNEIEAVVVDDELGYVFYADEQFAIRKWHADPDHGDAARELAVFARDGFVGQREGLAIYARSDGTGFLVATDQRPRATSFRLYRREGSPASAHDHSEVVTVIRTAADSTDGIDATSLALGPSFPVGALVAMNSADRNFWIFRWDHLAPR